MRKRLLNTLLIASITITLLLSVVPGASPPAIAQAPESLQCPTTGYADNDFYYLASYCEDDPGTIYVYDRDTLNLHTTIDLLHPRFMDSYGDLFVSTYGSEETDTGIVIYDKANDFNEIESISFGGDDVRTLQPMVDDEYIMVPVSYGANDSVIEVYNSSV